MLIRIIFFSGFPLQSPVCIIDDDDSEAQYSESEATTVAYSVRVMIVNSDKKKEYVMVKADMSPAKGFDEIKNIILASFPANIPQPHGDQVEFGYIVPGHGLRGKKEWIMDDSDAKKFLASFKGKKTSVTLWCYSQTSQSSSKGKAKKNSKRSRSRSPITRAGPSRYDAHVTKMAKVDEIYQKIHETHGNLYSPEQKRAWAHMVELGKHDSISQPPKKRFFQIRGDSESSPASSSHSSAASTSASTASTPSTLVTSPGRRVSIRSECIDQLKKWHALLDCGAITKEQYDEIQGTILSDVRKL